MKFNEWYDYEYRFPKAGCVFCGEAKKAWDYQQKRIDELEKHIRVESILKNTDLKIIDDLETAIHNTKKAFYSIFRDPHQWSSRGCETCDEVSDLIGRPFGCQLRD